MRSLKHSCRVKVPLSVNLDVQSAISPFNLQRGRFGHSYATLFTFSLPEQLEISEALEDQLEETIAINERKIEALRQPILKCAFGGKLVPQGPGD